MKLDIRFWLGVSLCAMFTALFSVHPALGQTAKRTIFVGPQLRDGFLDVDSGIRDSIKDIQTELKRTEFVILDDRDQAMLSLIVVARGIVTNGSVGFSSASAVGGVGSGFGFVVPNTVPTLTTLLRVGHYERAMQSEGPTWSRAAKTVVDDLLAWWEANRKAAEALK